MMDPFHIDDKNILNDDEMIQADQDSNTENEEDHDSTIEDAEEVFENEVYDLLSSNE